MVDTLAEIYKTKAMIMRYDTLSTSSPTVNVSRNAIETVEQFNYLRSLV